MPSLLDRIGLASKALVGTYTDASLKQAAGMLSGIMVGGGDPPRRGTADYLAAYRTMPWLRAVSSKVARSVASTRWMLYAGQSSGKVIYDPALVKYFADPTVRVSDPRGRARKILLLKEAGALREITDHPFLTMLDSTNPVLTGHSSRQITQTHIDLVGEAFWLKERDGLGTPIHVWPIPPSWVKALPTPQYRFFRVSFRGWVGSIPDTEILPFVDPDPENPYSRGSGVAQSLGDELETDEFAAKFVKATFYNRARPDFLISAKDLKPEDTRRMEADWNQKNQGFWRAFKPMFLNKEVTVTQFGQTFESLQLTQLREYERDTIVQVFGVPPETLGILTNSNRATIDAADYMYARWVLLPRLEFLRVTLQERLIPEYDERLILEYESPVMEDREMDLKVAQAAPWSRDVDEWRALQGLEPIADGSGRGTFMIPSTLIPQAMAVTPPPEDIGEGADQTEPGQDALLSFPGRGA